MTVIGSFVWLLSAIGVCDEEWGAGGSYLSAVFLSCSPQCSHSRDPGTATMEMLATTEGRGSLWSLGWIRVPAMRDTDGDLGSGERNEVAQRGLNN